MNIINTKNLGKLSNFLFKMTATRFIFFSIIGIILVGTLLLSLPCASRDGNATPFINALFTATSATCVTGLIVYDTFTHWTGFGQIVILVLIQVGGLGLMSMAAMIAFVLGRRISLKQRLLMAQTINIENTQGIVRLMKKVLVGTFAIEFIGAIILSIKFIPRFGIYNGIIKGIFHSVSAFCNSGFDIMGQIEPYTSMTTYVSDITVNLTISALTIIGGLGFIVWNDIWHFKSIRKLTLHTKIVLLLTFILITLGALAFYLLENDGVLAGLDIKGKILAPFFHSVTARTAGFNTINLSEIKDSSKLVTIILMFIGGSPGSTAGGIKTVTFAVMIIAVLSIVRGSSDVKLFKRKIDIDIVMRSFAIAIISITVLIVVLLLLTVTQDMEFIDLFFEAVSGFGTVGLSVGVTGNLTAFGKCLIIFLMFFGRVGVLATIVALTTSSGSENLYHYPEEKVMVG